MMFKSESFDNNNNNAANRVGSSPEDSLVDYEKLRLYPTVESVRKYLEEEMEDFADAFSKGLVEMTPVESDKYGLKACTFILREEGGKETHYKYQRAEPGVGYLARLDEHVYPADSDAMSYSTNLAILMPEGWIYSLDVKKADATH